MKINEKALTTFSTSNQSHVDKEGWLWKRGDVNKSFQKRFFILRGNLLFYFEKRTDKEPVGVIILEGCTIELAEDEHDKFAFKIVFHGEGKRTYIIGADSQDLMESWMKLLSCSSFDYMKLMVSELQQQLADIEENERLAALNGSNITNSDNASDQPRPPPRQRVNPFQDNKKFTKSWLTLHQEFGLKILSDRKVWHDKKNNV